MKDLAEEVILAHPLKVKTIASAKIKTDAIDSRMLAELLMADLIPQAHLRTRVKCRIHNLIDCQLLPAELVQTIEYIF